MARASANAARSLRRSLWPRAVVCGGARGGGGGEGVACVAASFLLSSASSCGAGSTSGSACTLAAVVSCVKRTIVSAVYRARARASAGVSVAYSGSTLAQVGSRRTGTAMGAFLATAFLLFFPFFFGIAVCGAGGVRYAYECVRGLYECLF